MHNIKSLRQKVDRMIEHIDARMKPGQEEPFPFHLFTQDEQLAITALFEQLERDDNGRINFRQVSRDNLDAIHYWLCLLQALEQEDTQKAATYRRRFRTPKEQLIARFLAIPLHLYDAGPINSEPIGHTIDMHGEHHRLYKGAYNNIIVNVLNNKVYGPDRLRDHLDEIWLWVDWYESERARAA